MKKTFFTILTVTFALATVLPTRSQESADSAPRRNPAPRALRLESLRLPPPPPPPSDSRVRNQQPATLGGNYALTLAYEVDGKRQFDLSIAIATQEFQVALPDPGLQLSGVVTKTGDHRFQLVYNISIGGSGETPRTTGESRIMDQLRRAGGQAPAARTTSWSAGVLLSLDKATPIMVTGSKTYAVKISRLDVEE